MLAAKVAKNVARAVLEHPAVGTVAAVAGIPGIPQNGPMQYIVGQAAERSIVVARSRRGEPKSSHHQETDAVYILESKRSC